MVVHHWSLFIWWTSIGAALYLLCLIGSIVAKKAGTATMFAMPSIVVVLYAAIPLMVAFPARDNSNPMPQIMLLAVPLTAVAMIPVLIAWRKSDRERSAARKRHEDEAEALLRKLGA